MPKSHSSGFLLSLCITLELAVFVLASRRLVTAWIRLVRLRRYFMRVFLNFGQPNDTRRVLLYLHLLMIDLNPLDDVTDDGMGW